MSSVAQISALLLAGVFLLVDGSSESKWTYKESDHWPGMCKSGQHQSPVNLDSGTTVNAPFEKMDFVNYEDMTPMNIVNNGHTVQLNVGKPKATVLANGGLHAVYYLAQVHFHWQSEHTVLGMRYPLEAHFVHYERSFFGVKEAMAHSDGLAVVGVLFKESPQDNPELEPLLEAVDLVDGKVNVEFPTKNLTLLPLLPLDQTKFYRYAGSLTTPGCNESVVWTVLANTVPISMKQVNRFNRIQGEMGSIGSNYRPIQPLNGRSVSLIRTTTGSGGFKTIPASTILIGSIASIFMLAFA